MGNRTIGTIVAVALTLCAGDATAQQYGQPGVRYGSPPPAYYPPAAGGGVWVPPGTGALVYQPPGIEGGVPSSQQMYQQALPRR
jgi:hypothetical protein